MTNHSNTVGTISPHEVHEQLDHGRQFDLLDVRTPVEYREVHIESARNLPLDSLDAEKLKADGLGRGDRPVYVVCRSGNRARKAGEKLAAVGIENVFNVAGGVQAWEASGLPVRRGKKAVSLERQVRIAAGSLVLLGVVLGAAWHPAFYVLSGFVGAGLIFAGVTDTCAMGLLIARMPWNRLNVADTSIAKVATADRPTNSHRRDDSCCSSST